MTNHQKKPNDPLLISYLTLRKAVGLLGISFPIILILGTIIIFDCNGIQSSISAYYHTGMRNLFVGLLCAIALFLFTYTGYDSTDSTAGNIGCIFALGVAFCPTSYSGPLNSCITEATPDSIISTIHFISATGLFLTLAYFSLFRFTKTNKDPKKVTGRKKVRNRIYVTCGIIMLVCILVIVFYIVVHNSSLGAFLEKLKPIFWMETLALWAFGVSWLTKGNAIYADIQK